MEQEHGSNNQTACDITLVSHGNIQERDNGDEPRLDSEQHNGLDEEEVHVLYLNVPPNDEPQVIDLSNLLVQEGIQMIESSDTVDHISVNTHVHGDQEIVIENESASEVSMVNNQSETQSAHALLGLSKTQTEGDHVQVSDILAAHRHTEHVMSEQEQNTPAEALLQLSSDPNTGTYIVDETGTMVPIGQIRSGTLLEVEDTGVTTIAICQCWCGREFISQEDLDRHKLAHRYQAQSRVVPGSHKCTLCLESFLSTKDLRAHHAEFHPGGMPWECNICHRTFHKKIAMKAHMRVHNTLTRYQCSSCKKVFFYKTALSRHLKMHSCEKPFKCTICGEMYHSLWDLRKHRMNHKPPMLFACDICTKVFKQKQTLFVHSRIHTGQKPYSCEVCHRNFSLKSTLVQHRRIHTGEKPNVCHVCQRAFRQNSTLKAHLRTHTNLKPYMCRYCKMRFAYRDEVTEHEHTHAHNKTWQCADCGMWFKNQSLLARHSRVHTNERPFQCIVCYKSFVQSGSLQSHMRSHTKEKPYQCRICSKAYYTSGTLLVHIRKFHNVEAKSVKEVFPVFNYIEDQKVFTIRNSLVSDLKPVITDVDHDEATAADKHNLEELLSKDNAIVEELVETSGEIIVHDSKILHERIILDVQADGPEIQRVEDAEDNNSQYKDKHNVDAEKTTGMEYERLKIETENDIKSLLNIESEQREVTEESGTEKGGQDEASQSSHAAHDRQEAALGLAELSLIGGEGIHLEKQPQSKTRTFFKEEEEDENDPHVTKIILSKEGGIMNSQDPHQCPVCGRIFGRKSIMIEHIRIHTDEKPYECDFCQARFRQNAQLRSHIRNNHTQVERYQCSFCHNRFLSRSITVRHINFHHKLKIKFCQNMDPAWTVDSAVWSDDNFKLNVNNPQFLKVSKKKKTNIKGNNESVSSSGGSPEDQQQVESTPPADTLNKYVIKVSLVSSGSNSLAEDNDKTHQDVMTETSGQSNIYTVHLESVKPLNKIISPALGELSASSSANQESQGELSISVGQSLAAPASMTSAVTEETSRPTETTTVIRADMKTDCVNSKIICRICAMQFRGISSLRYHMRKVHHQTLDPSEMSNVHEDVSIQSSEHQRGSATHVQTSKVSIIQSKQNEDMDRSNENRSLKIVVYDDSKKCVDENPKLNMPYLCLMCDQRYSSKVSLEEHLKCHSEEDVESVSLHRCDLCATVMKNTQQVIKHILKFHGVKQIYVCSICHREFYQQSSVYRHMKFLHKWEIKIRGEASIPVFVKPAPLSMHAPSNSPVVKVGKESLPDLSKQPTTKLSNSSDDSVTYVNLDIHDIHNLQIDRSDGQDVFFEVVDSDDKLKTLKIKGNDSDAVKAEAKIWNATQKSLITVPIMAESVESTSTPELCLISGDMVTSSDSPVTSVASASSVTCKAKMTNSTDTSSFIVVGSDKCAQMPVSKQMISQLLSALKNSSHGNITNPNEVIPEVIRNKANPNETIPKVIKIKNVSSMVNHTEAVSSTASCQNINSSCQYALKAKEEDFVKKCSNLPNSSNLKPPIIMSVKDIGATFANIEPRLEFIVTVASDTENANINVISVVDTLDNHSDEGLCLLPRIDQEYDQNKDIQVLQLEETKSEVVNQGQQADFVEGIKETIKAAETTRSSFQSPEADVKKCKKVMMERAGKKTIKSSSVTPMASIQLKNGHIKDDIKIENPEKTCLDECVNNNKIISKTSTGLVLSQKGHIKSQNSVKDVRAKVQTSRSSSPRHATISEHTKQPGSLLKRIVNSESKRILGEMTPHTKQTITNMPVVSNLDTPSGYRSSSGRLIKRKRFDDEIEEINTKRGKK